MWSKGGGGGLTPQATCEVRLIPPPPRKAQKGLQPPPKEILKIHLTSLKLPKTPFRLKIAVLAMIIVHLHSGKMRP